MSDFDRIITSAPLNSTAARVTAKGVHYEVAINDDGRFHGDAPPPMRDWQQETLPCRELAQKLIGNRIGRLRVVGLAVAQASGGSARWVVRCDCGAYEVRSTKALHNQANHGEGGDRCSHCAAEARAKRNYTRLGPRAIGEFK